MGSGRFSLFSPPSSPVSCCCGLPMDCPAARELLLLLKEEVVVAGGGLAAAGLLLLPAAAWDLSRLASCGSWERIGNR